MFGALVFTEVEVREAEQFINLITPMGPPAPTLNEFPTPVDDSADRSSVSLVLQDEYRIDDRLTLTAGLRYDNYEDIDSNVSPRVALVWRRSDQHIFKTQLARAFKPPSLIEDSGSLEVEIESETNDTLEFGHIYQGADLVLRNTIYFSKLDNLILFQDFAPFGYYNTGSFDLRGYELEVETSIDREWDINASLSLQDYVDEALPGATPWMLKLGVEYALMPLTGLHLQVNSFGSRDREEADTRGDFEQTTQADVSLRMQNFRDIDGLTFRAGILNILDDESESIRHLSTPIRTTTPTATAPCCGYSLSTSHDHFPQRVIVLRLSGKSGIIVLLCLASFVGLPSLAQDAASPRLKIGINLLPAIIAANQSLAASDGTNNLPIYLVYRENRRLATAARTGSCARSARFANASSRSRPCR